MAEANMAFANANDALAAGNLASYQRWVDEAERLLQEISELIGSSTDASALYIS